MFTLPSLFDIMNCVLPVIIYAHQNVAVVFVAPVLIVCCELCFLLSSTFEIYKTDINFILFSFRGEEA